MAKPASRFEPEPINPGSEESTLLKVLRVAALEAPGAQASAARLLAADGQPLELPESVYRVLVETVRELAEGNAVAVLPVRAEVTTQEAADLRPASSVPYLIKLIEAGTVPAQSRPATTDGSASPTSSPTAAPGTRTAERRSTI